MTALTHEQQPSKQCSVCGVVKVLSEFHRLATSKDGHCYYCKVCNADKNRQWRDANREKYREQRAQHYRENAERIRATQRQYHADNREMLRDRAQLRNFNMTAEQFADLLAFQGGVCAICGAEAPGGHGRWHVDHDHSCCLGRKCCGSCVRGLLCTTCNTGLGMFGDDQRRLASAIEYLRRTSAGVVSNKESTCH